jgi:hypothetical protein
MQKKHILPGKTATKPHRLWLARLVLPAAILLAQAASADVRDLWRTSDLSGLDNGDAVGSWSSISNRTGLAPVGGQPILIKDATPSGAAVVHFDSNQMTIASCPVAGLSAFSLAVVFKTDQLGVDEGSGWSTKSGIVDANESGSANDWGFAIRDTGYICFGTGSSGGSDQTVYLDNQPT